MELLGYLLFTCFVFLTVRCSEAQTTCTYPQCPTCDYYHLQSYRLLVEYGMLCAIGDLTKIQTDWKKIVFKPTELRLDYSEVTIQELFMRNRYDWRGCQECYCQLATSTMSPSTAGCPYPGCPTCDYNHYHSYRYDWRGCQECYCEWMSAATSAYAVTTGASWEPHPANYWSMSRSSLLSILLNVKQEAQTLIDTAKNTYDHILHSVIVNDVRKRRAADKEEESKK